MEKEGDIFFLYSSKLIDVDRRVSIEARNENIESILNELFQGERVKFTYMDNQIILAPGESVPQPRLIRGTVTDEAGEPMVGVTIIIKGTTSGTITNLNGEYELEVPDNAEKLVYQFIGMITQEISIEDKRSIYVIMEPDVFGIEEVVKIGYGTQKANNVTGSIASINIDETVNASDISIMQILHGSIAGLEVGQVDRAGEEPSFSIRGRTSISGEEKPLIVVDDVVYRGNIIDLNPTDIKSVSILKDASAAAIYGSQASNGVILLTTTKKRETLGGPEINFTSQYSLQRPWREHKAQSPEEYLLKLEHSDILQSRTAESGYLEKNPGWDVTANWRSTQEVIAYNAGKPFDWYDWITNDNPYTLKSDLSITNWTEKSSYYASVGYTDQKGFARDEGFNRITARINLSNRVTDWFTVDIQSFMTISEYDPQMASLGYRYLDPYANPYVIEDGEVTDKLEDYVIGGWTNPLWQATADKKDQRDNLFGNIVFNIDLPLEGLSYKGNFSNNRRSVHNYFFGSYESAFLGSGRKNESIGYDWSSDHILSYNRIFNGKHDLGVTLLYGLEERNYNYTNASASEFLNDVLGYNKLQAGAADKQTVSTGGWKESSLYNMGRIMYAFNSKYLLTATIRRDGFSGFSDENKFGYFPSLSLGWVVTEESFLNNLNWLNRLKLRVSYGTNGNRTIDRYQALAKVTGGMYYVSAEGSSIYGQRTTSLANPNIKWEKTTGIDLGVDFIVLSGKINGTIDYYNKNTTDLLYNVDIPGITGYSSFADNLGELHNHGFEMSLSSINIQMKDFQWRTDFSFSRNRNELKSLLGFDLDGDGKEDDLISEGLFIGESLNAIYGFEIDGLWQLDDVIPAGYDFGSYKVVDQNEDGQYIPADDKIILGNSKPAYRFSINNVLKYKDLTFSFFINSCQGGKDYYLGIDDLRSHMIFNTQSHFQFVFPENLDYWSPENPDARYQRPNIMGSSGIQGRRITSRSFVRLQDVRLTYNLGSVEFLNRIGIKNLYVFVHGKNIATWTKWPGFDPETGVGMELFGSSPVMKSYTMGIDLTL